MKNQIENNEMLAKFLDIPFEFKNVFIEGIGTREKNVYKTSFGQVIDIGLKFHSDWNWLMLVVEKMANIEGFNEIQNDLKDLKNTADINIVYNACIEFVKWYNENK